LGLEFSAKVCDGGFRLNGSHGLWPEQTVHRDVCCHLKPLDGAGAAAIHGSVERQKRERRGKFVTL
jgi:hypothetical protein